MGGFSKPLRRKIGLLTLVMALVTTGGWVRSYRYDEWIMLCPGEKTLFVLVSNGDGISFEQWPPPPKTSPILWSSHQRNVPDAASRLNSVLHIPYWSIVCPLTLISLWLLITKPRKSIQKKITEPVP